jgi:hypothetical protein
MFVRCVCLCCQVEVSATSWSFVQRSPTDCGVSCVIKNQKKYITRHNLLQSQNIKIWIFLRAICYKILLLDNVDISGFVFITQGDQSTPRIKTDYPTVRNIHFPSLLFVIVVSNECAVSY